MNATLTACDKDSSGGGGYVKTYEFKDKEEFLALYNEFKDEVPFSRWYVEVESDDEDGGLATESLVESWLE